MRGPLDVMLRWWKESNGHGNGHAAGNGRGESSPALAAPAARHEPAPEPPWLAQLDALGIPRTLHYPTTTLGRLLDQTADRFGDLPALVYNETRWTYNELLARVNRMAGGLSRLGVRKGDRLVLILPNCPEYVVAFFAAQKLGAILVNAGPLMGADDLRALMMLTTPHVVIGLDLQASQVVNAAKDSAVAHFVWASLQAYQPVIKRMGYQIKLWQGRERASGAAEHT